MTTSDDSPSGAASRDFGQATILVCEDDSALRTLIVWMLELHGFSVEAAADGLEALRIAEDREVSVVVTDAEMPGLSGPELIRQLRARFPGLGAVVISGHPDDALSGRDSRGYAFLRKPFDDEVLVQTIESLLGPSRRSESGPA